MTLSHAAGLTAFVLTACLALPLAGAPPLAADTAGICLSEARRAAARHGVPGPVMVAISLTETGRPLDGDLHPWPWTLNVAGKGYWLESRQAAAEIVRKLRATGARNFDLGCFQVNYRWHGQAFASAETMLDPAANADYAAALLSALHDETGDWSRAAGAYHSRTAALAARYRKRFDRLYKIAQALAPLPPPEAAPRLPDLSRTTFPLLAARAVSGASLFPAGIDGGPGLVDFGRTRGSLWHD